MCGVCAGRGTGLFLINLSFPEVTQELPAAKTCPKITSETSSGATVALFRTSLMTAEPRSWTGTVDKAPLNEPTKNCGESRDLNPGRAAGDSSSLSQGDGRHLERPRKVWMRPHAAQTKAADVRAGQGFCRTKEVEATTAEGRFTRPAPPSAWAQTTSGSAPATTADRWRVPELANQGSLKKTPPCASQ